MKNILIFLTLLTFSFGFAQINSINYKALIKDGSGNVITNQGITVQLSILEGVAQTNVYQETHTPTTDANGIIVLNIGNGLVDNGIYTDINWGSDNHFLNVQVDTGSGLVDLGTTQFMAVPYALTAGNVSGLETLDEGNGLGWRLKGQNPANYGNIGVFAVDLSIDEGQPSELGATGLGSFASGVATNASGLGSTALGIGTKAEASYSTSIGFKNVGGGTPDTWIETDPLFEIGNGDVFFGIPSNALTILKNGTITAPSFDLVEITDDKALITKEYADANLIEAGLEALNEGNGVGWRLKGKIPNNHGNIGSNAVDLSYQNLASTTNGATGSLSFAINNKTTASGQSSTAMGEQSIASGNASLATGSGTHASGNRSTAMGNGTISSGIFSTAMGDGTKAESVQSIALGKYNVGGGDPQSIIATDPLLEVGNGASDATRSNALTILKNGTITAPSFDLTEITDDKSLITKEYADTNLSSSGLEVIDEGNGSGWRIKTQDPLNYGNIGNKAIDLSYSQINSSDIGATGDFSTATGVRTRASGSASTAMGLETTASGLYSTSMGEFTNASGNFSTALNLSTTASGESSTSMGEQTDAEASHVTAIGRYNVGGGTPDDWMQTDPLFEIGNGLNSGSRSNALTVLKNGTITAPTFDLVEITDDKALITKEYADANLVGSGLEAIDEGNGSGWRIKTKDPLNYGNIGIKAIDLSSSQTNSSDKGATGAYSTAMGNTTEASGYGSTAMGTVTQATGDVSTAMGSFTLASGEFSTTMGKGTKAEAYSSTAIGYNNIGGGSANFPPIAMDPLFEIGNGANVANRANAFTVLKNGKVGIGNHQPTAFLEISSMNSSTEPSVKLIHEGTTGARINFTDTGVTNGNRWTLYGDADDNDAASIFNIFHPNKGNILRIQGDGEIGVNGLPNSELHVYHGTSGANDGFKLENIGANNNWWRMYTVNSTGNMNLYSKALGTVSVGNFNDNTGVYSSTSDRRLKKDFKPLPFSWSNFMNLETLSYLYKTQTNGKRSLGLIAQDVKTIYPELVSYNKEDDVYHLNYSGFGVVAIKAIQDLKTEVDMLKKENGVLKAELLKFESLEARLSALEATSDADLGTTVEAKRD